MMMDFAADIEKEVVLRSVEVSGKFAVADKVITENLASTLLLAVTRRGASQVVVKVLLKQSFDSELERRSALDEIAHHSKVPPHPNVLRLLASEETPEAILLVTPFTPDGDLWSLMCYGATYCEPQVRNCASQILCALAHVHQVCGLIHADVKPQNFLLQKARGRFVVRLCDFGLAERPGPGGVAVFRTVRGTSGWFAPEMLQHRSYGFPLDLFGVGLITFRMLGGYPPFDPPSKFQATVDFDDRCFCHIGGPCRQLISRLLCLEPAGRGTAADAGRHLWFTGPEPAPPTPEQLDALSAYGPPPAGDVKFWPAGRVREL